MMLDEIANSAARLSVWNSFNFSPPKVLREQSFKVPAGSPLNILQILKQVNFNPVTDELEARRFADDEIKLVVRQQVKILEPSN